jgi:hypothetical protein
MQMLDYRLYNMQQQLTAIMNAMGVPGRPEIAGPAPPGTTGAPPAETALPGGTDAAILRTAAPAGAPPAGDPNAAAAGDVRPAMPPDTPGSPSGRLAIS